MTFRAILFEVRDAVATITLNRPEEKNAIDDAMRADFAGLAPILADRADVRVVVIAGAGGSFSSGGRISHFERDWNTQEFRALSHRLSLFYEELEALEKPVIAAIEGVATGAGLQLALACDLRFAGASARLGFREHRIGVIPGHGGATRLVKLIGLSRAKELYFAPDLVNAADAQRLGVVNRVVPDGTALAAALETAADLASRAPHALGLTKRLLNAAADVDVKTGLLLESFAQSVAIKTRDHHEGVRAFLEKRPPRFEGE